MTSAISISTAQALISDISSANYLSLISGIVNQASPYAEQAANYNSSAEVFLQMARSAYDVYAQNDINAVKEYASIAASADISASFYKTMAYNESLSAINLKTLVSAQIDLTTAAISSARQYAIDASNSATLALNATTSANAWQYYIDASFSYQNAYSSYTDASNAYSSAYIYYIYTSDATETVLNAYRSVQKAESDVSNAYTNARAIFVADSETDISNVLNAYLLDISGHKTSVQNALPISYNYYLDASNQGLSVALLKYNDASMNAAIALSYATEALDSTAKAYNAYTNFADYFTPQPFSAILTQSYEIPTTQLTTATAFTTLNRYMLSYNGMYLTKDDSHNLVLTSSTSTYKDVLSKVFEAVKDNVTTFRIDSDMDYVYSLDYNSTTAALQFSNNWGQAANTTSGYLRFDFSNNRLLVKGRQRINDISYNYASDTSTFFSTVLYVYYDSVTSKFKLSESIPSGSTGTFTLIKSPILADMPSAFNPFQIPYQPNSRVSIADYVGARAKNTIQRMDNSIKDAGGKRLMSKYNGQVDVSGRSIKTDASANAMLDTIFASGLNLRYSKAVYKAFREGALDTKLACHSIADGTLGQNTVPYVYFTMEQMPDGSYHPFMVIASYSISDKPNRLMDVCRPPASGDNYPIDPVTRDATLQNYLTKIPMVNYGQVTDVTDNTMLATLLSDSRNAVSATPYNYASISAIGVAVDGVVIYPTANNTLRPAQAQAEITNTGIHIGRGMGLHYHADGQSVTSNNNNLNLYNSRDYIGHKHPPLIGFGLDGIALYGQYDVRYVNMDGASVSIDKFGGHTHGNYGYHYHAHTVLSTDLSGLIINSSGVNGETPLSSSSYNVHILMKGAWAGRINTIPEFWDTRDNAPNFTIGTNNSKFVGLA